MRQNCKKYLNDITICFLEDFISMYSRTSFLLVDFLLDWYSTCWKLVIPHRAMCKDMVSKKRTWDFLINGREKKDESWTCKSSIKWIWILYHMYSGFFFFANITLIEENLIPSNCWIVVQEMFFRLLSKNIYPYKLDSLSQNQLYWNNYQTLKSIPWCNTAP